MRIEFIGTYPVDAPQPCHLVELWVRDLNGILDFGRFTQAVAGEPESNWQVPYDERILNECGTKPVGERFPFRVAAKGDLRVAFFFHHLDLSKPLLTPAGPLELPKPTRLPRRLHFLEYEPPD